jgi:hypothetical protein
VADGKQSLTLFAADLREVEIVPDRGDWAIAVTLVRAPAAGSAPMAFRYDLALLPGPDNIDAERLADCRRRFLQPPLSLSCRES